jgi:hypothetical protein
MLDFVILMVRRAGKAFDFEFRESPHGPPPHDHPHCAVDREAFWPFAPMRDHSLNSFSGGITRRLSFRADAAKPPMTAL